MNDIAITGRGMALGAVAAAMLWAAPHRAAAQVDLSGFWEVRGEIPRAPPSDLTPEGKAEEAKIRAARAKETGVVAPEARWCRRLGLPFFMSSSPPLDFVQNKAELVILAEQLSNPQHIYLDGRPFPDKETFDEQSNGFSIGHFEGDTLVAETRYFSPTHGQPFIPGGGYKTTDTVLVERFKLVEDGKRMDVTFTWTDPKVLAKPHTYTFSYYRSEPGTYAYEMWCDAADPATSGMLVSEPPQD